MNIMWRWRRQLCRRPRGHSASHPFPSATTPHAIARRAGGESGAILSSRIPATLPMSCCSIRYIHFHTRLSTCGHPISFHQAPPYGVIAPPEARERLGASLRHARHFIGGGELDALKAELTAMPRGLSWGRAACKKMADSKRKFFHLDEAALRGIARGRDGVRLARLQQDLCDTPSRIVCRPSLVVRAAERLDFEWSALRGMQVNYQHTHYPPHRDEPDGDGFGRDIVTINVRGDGCVNICEWNGLVRTHAWWFALSEGDVWGMPDGYVRNNCTHGLPLVLKQSKVMCHQGCTECRISQSGRFGSY